MSRNQGGALHTIMSGAPMKMQGQKPMNHPMMPSAAAIGGLKGAMQSADQNMAAAGPRLHQMKAAYAKGGKHRVKLSPHGHKAVKKAMGHLQGGDPASALAALQASPDAMAHPDVQTAIAQMQGDQPAPSPGTMSPGLPG